MLVFSHPGYQVETLPCESLDANQVVVLIEGHTQEFRCLDVSGRPVGGCMILVSRTALPAGNAASLAGTDHSPGWPPDASIVAARTAQDGTAVVRGLQPGQYRFRCDKEGYVPVGGTRSVSVTVPDQPVDITLGPMFVFMAAITGDEVLGHAFVFDQHWKAAGVPGTSLQRVREEIEARYPGCLVATAAAMDSPAGSTVPLRVALKRGGVQVFEVPGFPLEVDAEPLVIDGSGAPREDRAVVRLLVSDASGRPVDPAGIYVLEGESLFTGIRIHAGEDGELWLRPGEYELHCRWPLLEGRLHPSLISVSSSSQVPQVQVQVDVATRRCTLEYQLPWGEPASEVHWELAAADARYSFVRVKPEPLEILVPVGPLQVSAKTPGRPAVTLQVDVPMESWEEPFRIAVADRP